MNRWLVVLLGWVLLGACFLRATPETPEVPKGSLTPASTLGAGDVFEVKVYDETELSGIYRVSSAGAINFPLIGKVEVDSLSASDASDLIQGRLGEKYLRNPQVNIFIKEYNSKKVSVFGQVTRPGTFNYEERMTVIQAVSMAGGFTGIAAKNNTNVTRLINNEEMKFPVPVEAIAEGRAKNFLLEPGDIVYVPESIW